MHLKTFTQWAARNVVVPFDVLAVRPNMRFQTGSMIYAAPNNGELGVLGARANARAHTLPLTARARRQHTCRRTCRWAATPSPSR